MPQGNKLHFADLTYLAEMEAIPITHSMMKELLPICLHVSVEYSTLGILCNVPNRILDSLNQDALWYGGTVDVKMAMVLGELMKSGCHLETLVAAIAKLRDDFVLQDMKKYVANIRETGVEVQPAICIKASRMELMNSLCCIAHEWFLLGCLLGVEISQMKAIGQEAHSCAKRLSSVIDVSISRGIPLSTFRVALTHMGYRSLPLPLE